MQRTAPFSPENFSLRRTSFLQSGFGAHRNKRIQLGVEFSDAIQASAREIDGRKLPPPETRGELNNRFQDGHCGFHCSRGLQEHSRPTAPGEFSRSRSQNKSRSFPSRQKKATTGV